MQLGGANRFTPQVIGPHEVPEILDAVDAEMVMNSVSDAVREVLASTMLPFKYEYQSDFAKHYGGWRKGASPSLHGCWRRDLVR
jgi:hypothetical protein